MSNLNETPQFDHKKPVGQVHSSKYRYLEQDGEWFTFAEYNRQRNRYEPEPKFVPKHRRSADELRDELRDVLLKMSELQEKLSTVQDHILTNLEAFQKSG